MHSVCSTFLDVDCQNIISTMQPAQHFTPWSTVARPCWHCRSYQGMTAGGSAALCSLPNACRVRSMPGNGCSAFEREVGADDDLDAGWTGATVIRCSLVPSDKAQSPA